ncbi:glycoside hydrolase family 95-like protein [Tessaracoccus defluvii]
MLFRSEPATCYLLPALPTDWPTGSITGLVGHHGLILDKLEWDTGQGRGHATLRRRPGTEWLRDSDSLSIHAGAGWTVPMEAVHVGTTPVTVELSRRPF